MSNADEYMNIEVIVIPVSDVDRAKRFYSKLGWRLDLDVAPSDDYRVIQFTPPGSSCSVIFGRGVSSAVPGSAQGLHLVVSDLEVVRRRLLAAGIEVSEPFYDRSGLFHHIRTDALAQGLQPQRNSYGSCASFEDPDGNSWTFQEVTVRLAGDENGGALTSVSALQAAFQKAKAAAVTGSHG
ncbi:MAG TPA: VOC family protein [Steroidobacteraceae bacterium]|nr:VOC family protein [Steroidobacteraceae bacterium]